MKRLYLILACLAPLTLFGQINYVRNYNGIRIISGSRVLPTTTITPSGITSSSTTPTDADPLRTALYNLFQPVDKSQVPTGFLEEYGSPLITLAPFNGVLSDSNKVNVDVWRFAYQTLYTSRIYGNHPLQRISSINDIIAAETDAATSGSPVMMLDVDYNTLRSDALTSNLLSYYSSQLHDVSGRPQSPYVAKNAFLATPSIGEASGSVSLIFKQSLYIKVSSKTLSSIAVDFGNGNGFQTATWDTPVSGSYTSDGTKLITIRLTYTDASTRKCYTVVDVTDTSSPQVRYDGTLTSDSNPLPAPDFTIPASGNHYGGKVYVQYAQANTSNPKKILRPLIVAEGFDISYWAPGLNKPKNGTNNYDVRDFVRELSGASNYNGGFDLRGSLDGTTAGYDLVFLDYNNGADDITNNAAVFEATINWVNQQKVQSSVSKNVVLGLSMGGLVARYALAKMTKAGTDPDTRLLITHDSPHRGANVPLGFQHLTRIVADESFLPGLELHEVFGKLHQALRILNSPAAEQMLIIRATGGESGTATNTFLDGAYRSMVTFSPSGPQPTYKFVATSLGSSCGTPFFSAGTELLNVQGNGFLGISWLGRDNFRAEVIVNAMPNYGYSGRVTKFRLWLDLQLLQFIHINIPNTTKEAFAPANQVPWDGAPGGAFNINPEFKGFDWYVVGAEAAIANVPSFCFVPVGSALDLTNFSNANPNAITVGGVSPGNASRAASFISQRSNTRTIVGQPIMNFVNHKHIAFTPQNGQWLFREMEGQNNAANACDAQCAIPASVISGDFPAGCGGASATFTIPAYASNSTYTWSVSSNLILISGQGTRSVVVQQNGTNSGTIQCAVTTPCGTTTSSKSVFVGGMQPPGTPQLLDDSCPEYTFEADPAPGATSYTWSYFKLPSGTITEETGLGSYDRMVLTGGGSYRIGVKAVGPCGTSSISSTTIAVSCGGGGNHFAAFPNPASDELFVVLGGSEEGSESQDESFNPAARTSGPDRTPTPIASTEAEIKLYDWSERLVYQAKIYEQSLKIPLHQLPGGMYYLTVRYGEVDERRKILIKK